MNWQKNMSGSKQIGFLYQIKKRSANRYSCFEPKYLKKGFRSTLKKNQTCECWYSQSHFGWYCQSHLGWHFRMLFQSSKLKVRTSLLPVWVKKDIWALSFELWALKELSKIYFVQPIPLGAPLLKAQSSKLKRLFCHVSMKRDVRALSFEL